MPDHCMLTHRYTNEVLLELDLGSARLTDADGDYLGLVLSRRHNRTVRCVPVPSCWWRHAQGLAAPHAMPWCRNSLTVALTHAHTHTCTHTHTHAHTHTRARAPQLRTLVVDAGMVLPVQELLGCLTATPHPCSEEIVVVSDEAVLQHSGSGAPSSFRVASSPSPPPPSSPGGVLATISLLLTCHTRPTELLLRDEPDAAVHDDTHPRPNIPHVAQRENSVSVARRLGHHTIPNPRATPDVSAGAGAGTGAGAGAVGGGGDDEDDAQQPSSPFVGWVPSPDGGGVRPATSTTPTAGHQPRQHHASGARGVSGARGSRPHLGDATVAVLCRLLPRNPHLRKLVVEPPGCLEPVSALSLAAALAHNTALTHFQASDAPLPVQRLKGTGAPIPSPLPPPPPPSSQSPSHLDDGMETGGEGGVDDEDDDEDSFAGDMGAQLRDAKAEAARNAFHAWKEASTVDLENQGLLHSDAVLVAEWMHRGGYKQQRQQRQQGGFARATPVDTGARGGEDGEDGGDGGGGDGGGDINMSLTTATLSGALRTRQLGPPSLTALHLRHNKMGDFGCLLILDAIQVRGTGVCVIHCVCACVRACVRACVCVCVCVGHRGERVFAVHNVSVDS